MGRAERRRKERYDRIQERKDKILVTKEDLGKIKKDIARDASEYSTEALMTCFALAEHRMHKFGATRIARSLQCIDDLMGAIIDGSATMDDYMKELENETGIVVKCED